MWTEGNLKEFTIIRWQGGYGDVIGRLPGANLTWKAKGIRIYTVPGLLDDGFNVIRGAAVQICIREKIRVITLVKVD